MSPYERYSGRRAQAGFSYLWLLLLVAFMGVGLTVAVEIDSTAVQRDREKELLAQGRQFRTAIGRYYESLQAGGKREYPSSLDDLLQDRRVPGVKRHLRRIFVDPMTRRPEWGLVKVGGRIVGVHSLSEGRPIKQDGFEAEDMGLRGKDKYSEWLFVYPSDLLLQMGTRGTAAERPASDLQPVPAYSKDIGRP
jgi:type II secretory pathway pseudopilin PulG